MYFSWQ